MTVNSLDYTYAPTMGAKKLSYQLNQYLIENKENIEPYSYNSQIFDM